MKRFSMKYLLPLILLLCLLASCSADTPERSTGTTPANTDLPSSSETTAPDGTSLPAAETTTETPAVTSLPDSSVTTVPQTSASAPPTVTAPPQTSVTSDSSSPVTVAVTSSVTVPSTSTAPPATLPTTTPPATTSEMTAAETTPAAAVAYFAVIGADGAVLCERASVSIDGCETVFDGLKKFCTEQNLALETSGSGAFAYVKSIGGLKEFELGPLAGWVYAVNGVYATKGIGGASLSEGDEVVFYYTMNLGKDIMELLGS